MYLFFYIKKHTHTTQTNTPTTTKTKKAIKNKKDSRHGKNRNKKCGETHVSIYYYNTETLEEILEIQL